MFINLCLRERAIVVIYSYETDLVFETGIQTGLTV